MQGAGRILGSVLTCGLFWLFCRRSVPGGEPQARPSLEHDILPLFKARCQKCHGPVKPKGKLNLSSARSLARGGESGPVVVPGNLDESLLWDLVSNDEMPPRPGEPLSADEKVAVAAVDRTGGQGPAQRRCWSARPRRGPTTGHSDRRRNRRRRRCAIGPACEPRSIGSSRRRSRTEG